MIKGRPLLTAEQIRKRVEELGAEISSDYRGAELLAVGILKGAFMFYSDLIRQINTSLRVDFIHTASYVHTDTSGEVEVFGFIREKIENRDVLLIEDIADTGVTLQKLKEMILKENPRSLRICAFLNKQGRRRVELTPDYTGFEIPDIFVVGYGLDCDGMYRNLPYIAQYIGS